MSEELLSFVVIKSLKSISVILIIGILGSNNQVPYMLYRKYEMYWVNNSTKAYQIQF